MTIKIHHLNCISSCPLGGKLMDGRTEGLVIRGHLTCHCLLLETRNGLVLVDTGYGLKDIRDPQSRLSRFFLTLIRPDFREELTAIRQIEKLGFDPHDVRHIILTHLDFDHAGGLDDFPHAQVHLLNEEVDYASAQKTWLDRQRFRPPQWSTRGNWKTYTAEGGDKWFGFDKVRSLEGLSDDIALIPLIGHTHGHCGVAVRQEERWILLAGDAYFFHEEMNYHDPRCTPGLRFYQWMMEKNRKARLKNQTRLRYLTHYNKDVVTSFCSHDLTEFERLSGRSAGIPPEAIVNPRGRAESQTETRLRL